ncbi:iron(III) transport system substrate-binding protein [Novosphingobium chloroacetimidivorans]|uniref:Iron(III) transport system substrate-binding protein n=1 Tax=Novosphingobium chloroacetimidivorans TaxID=1428314 RepID=A0A7W7NYQ2_9SPHN|nr:ABC transporter substrate-binding protein [Novosphingobium chloroacetimidivorans]MBB4860422.1 iron(III) transport system substrate-binding protein [Novosphingobium chloroacetimidivorans]
MRNLIVMLSIAVLAVPAAAQRPSGYPRFYESLIATARAERVVCVYGNADAGTMAPLIAAFHRTFPGVQVQYSDLGSTALYRRFVTEKRDRRPSADLVWSSAMDLQAKLINDGYAQAYQSPEKPALPATAVWKNMGYGVTAEPVAIIYNKRLVPPAQVPRTHEAFERLLRNRRAALTGKIATYDPALSDVGYQYLVEDYAITRDTRSLLQAMAATRPLLARTTKPMLDAVAQGRAAIAYNVVGPYAIRVARRDARVGVVFPRDYTIVASRIAFIARDATHPAAAKLFLDFLLSRTGQSLLARQWLLPVRGDVSSPRLAPGKARPIRVGPQLLVHLDTIKRRRFLADWSAILSEGAKLK